MTARRTWLAALSMVAVALVAAPARAFECGGGGDYLESELGVWCQIAAGELPRRPGDVEAMLAYARRTGEPRWRRAIAAMSAGELLLRTADWAGAERALALARSIDSRYSGYSVDAGRAVALLRLGRREEAASLAESVARAECDAFATETSTYFDQGPSCQRVFGVLSELAPDAAARSATEARWERFRAEARVGWRAEAAMALAECLVRGEGACDAIGRGAASPSCGAPDPAGAVAAIPIAQRASIRIVPSEAEVATIELDGTAPAELVVAATGFVDDEARELASALWVLRCDGGAWALAGRLDFEVDEGWDGTYDDRPGFRVLRAETLPGVGHDFVRIEHVDVRGAYDPRFICRRLVLAHLVLGALVPAFDAVVRCEIESGPDRAAQPTEIRGVVYRRTSPPAIRFTQRTEDPETGRSRVRCRTIYTFDGRTFVPADPSCR